MAVRRKRPLTSHRWFPVALALWFAALFGLSSLAVPPPLLERLVLALGVDRLIPAAAPPLGQTARLLIAAGLSTLGEILGLLIGRGLAARHRRRAAHHIVEARQEAPPEPAPVGPAEARPRQPLSACDLLEAHARLTDVEAEARIAETPRESDPVRSQPAPDRPDIVSAPLDTLGVVQLSERLALALQARRPEARFGDSEDGAGRVMALASLQRISGAG